MFGIYVKGGKREKIFNLIYVKFEELTVFLLNINCKYDFLCVCFRKDLYNIGSEHHADQLGRGHILLSGHHISGHAQDTCE